MVFGFRKSSHIIQDTLNCFQTWSSAHSTLSDLVVPADFSTLVNPSYASIVRHVDS